MDLSAGLRGGPSLEVSGVERIAVFRALHLGDYLCSVPALRALKDRFPDAEVTLIGLRWTRDVLERYPCVDRFLEFPGYQGLEGVAWDRSRTEEFLAEAYRCRYDLAIQMHGDGRLSNGFVARLGARASLGYGPGDGMDRRQLDVELPWSRSDHEIRRWLRLVNVVGAIGAPELEFPLLPEDWMEAERVASECGIDLGRPVIGLHPGGRDAAKRWPPERFARVADRLAGESGAQVVITGTREELDIARRVAVALRAVDARVATGRTSIGAVAALVSRMQLLVTNDTGISHLAAALGVPSVVLFGPTDPNRWAPLDTRSHAAVWSGPGNPITAISVDQVVEAALAVVERWAFQTY
ncbi:MAG: glycosyltransferase family 9 protein [Sphingomonadaceae bacterium]